MNCYKCGNSAEQRCPSCGRHFCPEHGQKVAAYDNRVFCKDCLASGRRMTAVLFWVCLPILFLAFAGMIAFYFLSR
jgi:hypothetical protein